MEEQSVVLYDSWTGRQKRIPMSEWKKMKPEIECYADSRISKSWGERIAEINTACIGNVAIVGWDKLVSKSRRTCTKGKQCGRENGFKCVHFFVFVDLLQRYRNESPEANENVVS